MTTGRPDKERRGLTDQRRIVALSMGLARGLALALGLAGLFPGGTSPAGAVDPGPTVAAIRARGEVVCGISPNMTGMSAVDTEGQWTGFDVSYCRALAAAVLHDATLVRFVPLGTTVRFKALGQGDVDVLSRATTWTLARDAGMGLSFVGLSLMDGQRLLAWADLPGDSLDTLPAGTRICGLPGTTSLDHLQEILKARGLDFPVQAFLMPDEARSAFFRRECEVFTDDGTALAAIAFTEAPRPDALRLLPEVLSEEPLGPVVRDGDPQWADVCRWVLFALVQAEAWGVGQENVEAALVSQDHPEKRRFLGLDPGVGEPLGLDDLWVRRILQQVGNYREVFEQTLGEKSSLKLDRGKNKLLRDGGVLFSPPFR